MKRAIITAAAVLPLLLQAKAGPIRIKNERAIEERAERVAIRAAARESAAELIRANKLSAGALREVAPLFPDAGGRALASNDVVRVDGGAIGVVTRDVAADETDESREEAIKIKNTIEAEAGSTAHPKSTEKENTNAYTNRSK